jgi:hypothetical protein
MNNGEGTAGNYLADELFRAAAARISFLKASSSILSPSILEGSTLGESQFHDALVGLAGADYSGVRPNRNASPFPFLDHLGVSRLDEGADAGERFPPPVV